MTTVQTASIQQIRAHFPALDRVHAGHPVAYFDGPGGTQVPRAVVQAMGDYLTKHNANTHWNYPSSQETDRILQDARAALADYLGATPGEVAFGPNMTTLTFHLGRALEANWGPGDAIVVTELDHHANIDPWRRLAAERGLTVRSVRLDPRSGELDWDDLARALIPNTKLLAIGAASNALGTLTDVARAAALARKVGALVFVDAVHLAPHHPPDVRALDCDFLVCSTYKFYGPHLGVLYGRRALLEALDAPKLSPSPEGAPERWETGTQNHEGIAGAAAAVDFLAGLAPGGTRRERLLTAAEAVHTRNRRHTERLWEALSQVNGVRLFGPPPDRPRTPTVSFAVGNRPSGEVAAQLAARSVFASHGDFYAQTVVQRLGLTHQGLVRAGCACYTTQDEVDRLIAGVRELA